MLTLFILNSLSSLSLADLDPAPHRCLEFSSDSLTQGLKMILPPNLLKYRIGPSFPRYPTFTDVISLMIERDSKVLVETGTSRYGDGNCRGDGCSTLIFGEYAYITGGKLYSVDISEENCRLSRKAVQRFGDAVEVILSDSIPYLKEFEGMIDFLYLDSYDFDEKNPKPSQQHHLKEIEAVYDKLHDKTIILLDDCNLPHGGKCPMVIDYLDNRGWKKFDLHYQVIFIKEE